MRTVAVVILMFFIACSNPGKKGGKSSEEHSSTQTSKTSASSNMPAELSVSCSKEKDHRKIQSMKKAIGTGCEVSYSKYGESKVIGSAMNDMDYCKALVERVKGNLEKASFTCK